MKIRKLRLVLACINFTSAAMRLVAALVNMASNYIHHSDNREMEKQVSDQAGKVGLSAV